MLSNSRNHHRIVEVRQCSRGSVPCSGQAVGFPQLRIFFLLFCGLLCLWGLGAKYFWGVVFWVFWFVFCFFLNKEKFELFPYVDYQYN